MQLKQFFLAIDDDTALEECNRFLRSVRLLEIDRQFVAGNPMSGWSILVHYLPDASAQEKMKKTKIDYREILDKADFELFSRLRKERKLLAERDGVPVYAVFTNEQLAEIARSKISTPAKLAQLEGVGEGKLAKYSTILEVVIAAGKQEDGGGSA